MRSAAERTARPFFVQLPKHSLSCPLERASSKRRRALVCAGDGYWVPAFAGMTLGGGRPLAPDN